jgi:hypothetical protein
VLRPVARIGRAADSKSDGWGFESLLACQFVCDEWWCDFGTISNSWVAHGGCFSVFS